MIKVKTKKEIREELEKEIQQYLSTGGEIKDIERGTSGKELGANINHAIPLSEEKKIRTPLTEEINALDERKKLKQSANHKSSPKRPKKKIIYDDFGEPLREVWEE